MPNGARERRRLLSRISAFVERRRLRAESLRESARVKRLEGMVEQLAACLAENIHDEERRAEIYRRNRDLQREICTRDRTMALLHTEIEALRGRVVTAARRIDRTAPRQQTHAPGAQHCMCCFEDIAPDAPPLRCRSNHLFCRSCVDRCCAEARNRTDGTESDVSIACLAPVGCTSKLGPECLMLCAEGTRLVEDGVCARLRPVVARIYRESRAEQYRFGKDEDVAFSERLAFLRSDGSFAALQCGMCGYGPILHKDCDDLIEHHEQRTPGGGMISNKCPACGHLSSDVQDMPRWTGGPVIELDC